MEGEHVYDGVTAEFLWDSMPEDWRQAIARRVTDQDMRRLADGLREEARQIVPERARWFRALHETPLASVRAVLLGQDPYPNSLQAEGLAFSIPSGAPVAPSLRRILAEAAHVSPILAGETSLLPWARRGVLLLNTSLTVPAGVAGGHLRIGWQQITLPLIRATGEQGHPVAYLALGRQAQASIRRAGIRDDDHHLVVECSHPAARRGEFVGSDPFGQAKQRLLASDVNAIDWSLP